MNEMWWRAVIEVTDDTGIARGWLVGSDYRGDVLPNVGDLVTLTGERLESNLDVLFGTPTLPVLRRHFHAEVERAGDRRRRVVFGARVESGLDDVSARDEWLEYSPSAERCVYGGCARDNKREADSALWSCITSGHNLCLSCDRPVRGSGYFCAYHDRSEFE
ncbi:hypothetical protein ELQ92_12475 [Labedella populi]|uniref:Uncharacterized protein n=1 Tax=Labedella populi TaxID=2498850 RepID=A0A444Q6U4_9MICO|nr:hypothetical protein [Labedella populi]RWZ59635.1 hypothetical protein ELQ92_12475 [Labedella populi]